jgi:outer membrane protein TolC
MEEPLPADLESCHASIRQLRRQLAQTRKLLISIMGHDPTDTQAVFAYQQAMSVALDPTPAEAEPSPSKPKPKKKI